MRELEYIKTNGNHTLELMRILNEHDDAKLKNWLEKGYNPNVPYVTTLAITRCIDNYYVSAVEILTDYGADINTKNKYGQSHLMHAIKNEAVDIAKILINLGATIGLDVYEEIIQRRAKEIALVTVNKGSISKDDILALL
jgi:ankyrin repeat protein